MKNKTIWKDTLREVWKTRARFLSIFAIILIGVAFFAGLVATGPVMKSTADDYFNEHNLMDIEVMSTLGMTDEDISILEEVEGANVESSYMADAVLETDQTTRFFGYHPDKEINEYSVVDGRLPENSGEVALDANDEFSSNFSIGDTVSLDTGTDDNFEESFSTTEFEVVGFVQSPMYIEQGSRGNTSIGAGSIEGFAVIPESDFNMEQIPRAVLSFDQPKQAYDADYQESVNQAVSDIENRFEERTPERLQEVQDQAMSELEPAQEELNQGRADLEEGREALNQARDQLESQTPDVPLEMLPQPAAQQIEDSEAQISDQEDQLNQAEEELEQGEQELQDAREEINNIEEPQYMVNSYQDLPGLSEFGDNAERIQAIASIFPVFFFLLAALISFTTMKRMVDDGRNQIGTMKALGYSNRDIGFKYYAYAIVATITGAVLGLFLGFWLFPSIILNAYSSMYNLPGAQFEWYWWIAIISFVGALIATLGATWYASRRLLENNAATLLKPEAPKKGTRIFLERLTPIWNRMSFVQKVASRNLFRYKGRMFMTIFGVAGGMALLLTGFGLSDSIGDIAPLQFGEIYQYEATLYQDDAANEQELESLDQTVQDIDEVEGELKIQSSTVDADDYEASLIVPSDAEKFQEFVTLRDESDSDHVHQLSDDGAYITQKLADLIGVEEGDTIEVSNSDNQAFEVPVQGIVEHYLGHNVYMSDQAYSEFSGEESQSNARYLQLSDISEERESEIEQTLTDESAGLTTVFQSTIIEGFNNSMGSLTMVTLVLIVSAGALAFVILYNLTNINVSERERELSTIKVLGFYDTEVTRYVYRENMVLTVLGILAGYVVGFIMHRFVLSTAELNELMFVRTIHLSSYLWAALLMLVFSLIVMVVMHFKLKNIDMVEALKAED